MKSENPFRAHHFKTIPTTYTSYVLAHESVAPLGPHLFSGERAEISPKVAVILHYESACFFKWKTKFEQYARKTNQEQMQKISFSFYRESVRAARNQLTVWKKWKMVPSTKNKEGKKGKKGIVYIRIRPSA